VSGKRRNIAFLLALDRYEMNKDASHVGIRTTDIAIGSRLAASFDFQNETFALRDESIKA